MREVKELEISENPLSESTYLDLGQGLSIGSQAPEFELPDGHGQLHALTDYLGNDIAQKYPALPIKVAELPSEFAAERALWRIRFAMETDIHLDTEEITVDLRDLQES